MASKRVPAVKTFRGLNNVGDPLRLGLEWFTTADNVDVTAQGAVRRAKGFVQSTTNTAISGAYATADLQRLYLVDNGELRQMNPDLSYRVLRTGLSARPMNFEEVNGVVFYANGIDFGTIEIDGIRPWGIQPPEAPTVTYEATGELPPGLYQVVCSLTDSRGMEGSNSTPAEVTLTAAGRIIIDDIPQVDGYTTNVYVTAPNGGVFHLLRDNAANAVRYEHNSYLGRELPFFALNPPRGDIPAYFGGRMYLAESFPEIDASIIWNSLPLHYHHFNSGAEGITVPGIVRMVKGVADGLIIGTDRAIFAYDGEKITQLANYGVVPGWHAQTSNGTLYFWSLRGLCKALPFANITESTVSVPPGLSAGASVIEKDGMRRYVVALRKGGQAFNRRST